MFENKIVETLLCAVEKSFTALFNEHSGEHFYYCTLVMAEASTPCISAQSEESLMAYMEDNGLSDSDIYYCKWSWADSDYCAYGYDEYFGEVSQLFEKSFEGLWNDIDKFQQKYDEWFNAMETVMTLLDEKGIFVTGNDRDRVFVYSEESPPDEETEERDIQRAKRMNPSSVYEKWVAEL